MTAKDKYRLLCTSESTIPVFSQDWWLDIVCGADSWNVVLVEEKEKIQAALPFYMPLRGLITMPLYSQTMGPWFAPTSKDTKYAHLLATRQALCKQLIEQLPSFSSFLQNSSYHFTDWLPFYWAGFKQSTRYTYILPDISDTNLLQAQMSSNVRRNIQRAELSHKLTIRKGITIKDFLKIQRMTFDRQHLPYCGDEKLLTLLIEQSRKRNQGDLWGTFDAEGRLHAVAFIIWQKNSAWYLAGGANPELRHSGAQSLLLWKCIQEVSQHTSRFDFEGSMIPGVERFFREFGAVQMPFFTISKGGLSISDRIRLKLKKIKS